MLSWIAYRHPLRHHDMGFSAGSQGATSVPRAVDISRVGGVNARMPRRKSPPRLVLDRVRKSWFIRDGHAFVRLGLPEAERAAAEKRLAKYLGEKHQPEVGPNPLIADVLSVYAQERLPQTRAVRKAAYNALSLLKFWGTMRVSEITPSNCLGYAENRTPAAARRDLGAARASSVISYAPTARAARSVAHVPSRGHRPQALSCMDQ